MYRKSARSLGLAKLLIPLAGAQSRTPIDLTQWGDGIGRRLR